MSGLEEIRAKVAEISTIVDEANQVLDAFEAFKDRVFGSDILKDALLLHARAMIEEESRLSDVEYNVKPNVSDPVFTGKLESLGFFRSGSVTCTDFASIINNLVQSGVFVLNKKYLGSKDLRRPLLTNSMRINEFLVNECGFNRVPIRSYFVPSHRPIKPMTDEALALFATGYKYSQAISNKYNPHALLEVMLKKGFIRKVGW